MAQFSVKPNETEGVVRGVTSRFCATRGHRQVRFAWLMLVLASVVSASTIKEVAPPVFGQIKAASVAQPARTPGLRGTSSFTKTGTACAATLLVAKATSSSFNRIDSDCSACPRQRQT